MIMNNLSYRYSLTALYYILASGENVNKSCKIADVKKNQEVHMEHFLFGCRHEEIIRKIPCSVLLVKKTGPVTC